MILVQCIRDLEHRFDETSGWCANCGKLRADGQRIGRRQDRFINPPRCHRASLLQGGGRMTYLIADDTRCCRTWTRIRDGRIEEQHEPSCARFPPRRCGVETRRS